MLTGSGQRFVTGTASLSSVLDQYGALYRGGEYEIERNRHGSRRAGRHQISDERSRSRY